MADDMMQEGKEAPPVAFETPKGSNVPTLSGWLAGEHATASTVKPGVDLFSPAGSTSSRALRFSLSPELADDETESLRKQVRSLTEQLQRAKNEISDQASLQNGDNPGQEPSACLNCTDLRQDLAGLRELTDVLQQSLQIEKSREQIYYSVDELADIQNQIFKEHPGLLSGFVQHSPNNRTTFPKVSMPSNEFLVAVLERCINTYANSFNRFIFLSNRGRLRIRDTRPNSSEFTCPGSDTPITFEEAPINSTNWQLSRDCIDTVRALQIGVSARGVGVRDLSLQHHEQRGRAHSPTLPVAVCDAVDFGKKFRSTSCEDVVKAIVAVFVHHHPFEARE